MPPNGGTGLIRTCRPFGDVAASTVAGKSGFLMTTVASLLWGTTFIATGLALQSTDPYTLVFLRFAVGSAVILPLSILSKSVNIWAEMRKGASWVLGGVYSLGFLFQYVGQANASAAEASLLANLAPTLVPLLAIAVLKEVVGTRQKFSTVLGFFGLLLVVSPNLEIASGHLVGDVLLFGTSVCYAAFIVLSKKEGVGSLASAFAIIVIIAIFLTSVSLVLGNHRPQDVGTTGWAAILWLGIPCSVLAIALYLKGLSSITASQSATLLLVQLLEGFTVSALVFGAPYLIPEVAGAVSISTAVVLSTAGKRITSTDASEIEEESGDPPRAR